MFPALLLLSRLLVLPTMVLIHQRPRRLNTGCPSAAVRFDCRLPNGQPYLLPGMPTNYVLTAQAGAAFSQSVAAGVIGYSPALTQIDMTLPQQVRLVVSNSASTPSCRSRHSTTTERHG